MENQKLVRQLFTGKVAELIGDLKTIKLLKESVDALIEQHSIEEDDTLKLKLSEFGTVHICKKGTVFTLLITGEKLTNWIKVNEIQMTVLAHVGDKYPFIECMVNTDNLFSLVLLPKS